MSHIKINNFFDGFKAYLAQNISENSAFLTHFCMIELK